MREFAGETTEAPLAPDDPVLFPDRLEDDTIDWDATQICCGRSFTTCECVEPIDGTSIVELLHVEHRNVYSAEPGDCETCLHYERTSCPALRRWMWAYYRLDTFLGTIDAEHAYGTRTGAIPCDAYERERGIDDATTREATPS